MVECFLRGPKNFHLPQKRTTIKRGNLVATSASKCPHPGCHSPQPSAVKQHWRPKTRDACSKSPGSRLPPERSTVTEKVRMAGRSISGSTFSFLPSTIALILSATKGSILSEPGRTVLPVVHGAQVGQGVLVVLFQQLLLLGVLLLQLPRRLIRVGRPVLQAPAAHASTFVYVSFHAARLCATSRKTLRVYCSSSLTLCLCVIYIVTK